MSGVEEKGWSSSDSNMALQVSPFTESELPQFTTLTNLAFQTGLGHLLTGPNTPEGIALNESKTLKAFKNDPHAQFLKVTDASTGQIIAAAKWLLYPHGNSEEELDEMFQMPTVEQGYKKEWEPVYRHLNENRRETVSTRPYFFLSILVTHPEHHRRGAGGMLVKWGTGKADELGIECYLESSIEGRPLYERLGFRVVKEVEFKMADFGRGDLGTDVNCIMHRPAIGKK